MENVRHTPMERVDCERIRTWQEAGILASQALTPELMEHLQACASCRRVFEELADPAAAHDVDVPEIDYEELEREVSLLLQAERRSVLGRLRQLRTPVRLAVILAVALAGCAFIALEQPRNDWHALSVLALSATLLAIGIPAAAFVLMALSPLSELPRASSEVRFWVTILALIGAAGLTLPVTWLRSDAGGALHADGLRLAPCLLYGATFGLLCFALWKALDRSSFPTREVWWSAALSAGFWANIALSLHCARSDFAHVLLAHISLVPALVVVAALMLRRVRRESASG